MFCAICCAPSVVASLNVVHPTFLIACVSVSLVVSFAAAARSCLLALLRSRPPISPGTIESSVPAITPYILDASRASCKLYPSSIIMSYIAPVSIVEPYAKAPAAAPAGPAASPPATEAAMDARA